MTNGFSWGCKTANDQAEFDEALQSGWFATLADAGLSAGGQAYVVRKVASWRKNGARPRKKSKVQPVAPVEQISENAPATRAELEQKATELNVKFDGRTNDKRLGEKIEAALKGES